MGGRYNSLFFLSRFQAELDRLFKEALELDAGEVPATTWQPAIDIVETVSSILILVELPGCSADDLALEVKGPLLVVSGSRAVARAERAVRFLCMERTPGRFSREIQLFWPVNSHEGRAVLGGGLLTVEFPKIEDKRQAAHSLHIEERFEPAGPEPQTTDRKEGSR
jgi:HSP20 family molecular chaperone IbpA